jgi:DNA-binding NarL/FixJ family response regulator
MSTPPGTRLLIVDDHPLFRVALVDTLKAALGFEIADVGSAREAIELAGRIAFDVAVVDVLMPTTSGVTLCRQLYKIQPNCKVLVLSANDDPCFIADLLRGHACGFALKTQPVEEIVEAIRQVLGGLRYTPPTVSRDALEAELPVSAELRLASLSRREREIFELIIRGNSNDDITRRLFISRRTVETHRQRVKDKLAARTVAEMQRIATRLGGIGT